MSGITKVFDVFKVFQNSEAYFESLIGGRFSGKMVLNQVWIILFFSFLYGIVMGSYNSWEQTLVTGIKVPVLFILALFICFPAFFVIQYILGSRMGLVHMINMILSGFVLCTTIMVSFAPIVIFFMITGNNYAFLKLLHVAIFVFSGIFGMRTIIEALKYSCEKKNVYPKIGLNIFKLWIFIFAFVGVQLAWNLRPFLGDKGMPFELFREKEGNFYLAVIHAGADLIKPDSKEADEEVLKVDPNKTTTGVEYLSIEKDSSENEQ